jgi:hypothetical protein
MNSPVVIIGPHWAPTHDVGSPINLTSDATRGSKSVTLASTSGLSVGQLVVVDETTDISVSRWVSGNGAQTSAWFEESNRPLGDTMQIASIAGNTVTFTTNFPITYKVSQAAHVVPLLNQVNRSGVEDLYFYGGQGGDAGGGIHFDNCAYCWAKHVEGSYNTEPINIDLSLGSEVRDSYIHDAPGGLHSGSGSYGVVLNWYTSDTLIENDVVVNFDKVDAMRSAGGGNVFGYNYFDNGADLGGQFEEDLMDSSHMTTPHYELFEGNQSANADSDDTWGNAVYTTYFRNQMIGKNRNFPSSGPYRAAGLTQYNWWYSFVGNVLGTPTGTGIFSAGYETDGVTWANSVWTMCYQHSDGTLDGGKCMSTQLRDGNYDYVSKEVHWHGIGGTGAGNGLTPPANSTLPVSMYLTSKPGFFGANPWPWVNGSNAATPLPGTLPARQRYDAGTPNG